MLIRLDDIIDAACHVYGFDREKLLGLSRRRRLAEARMVAYYLARKHTRLSLPEIGDRFARDHTTILSGVRRIGTRLEHDGDLADRVWEVEQLIPREAA